MSTSLQNGPAHRPASALGSLVARSFVLGSGGMRAVSQCSGRNEGMEAEMEMRRSTRRLCRGPRDAASEPKRLRLKVIPVPDLSEDVLRRCGVGPGKRVLDFECGVGDTSLLIAGLVGPTGVVVGIDQSADFIDVAERRATVAGRCYWTRFAAADPNTFVPDERFDVVVVRLALLLRSKHAAFLRLCACARPDGVIMVVSGEPVEKADSNRPESAPDCRDRLVGGLRDAGMAVSRHWSRRDKRQSPNV
jgi:SAM-dependent methyltransferase